MNIVHGDDYQDTVNGTSISRIQKRKGLEALASPDLKTTGNENAVAPKGFQASWSCSG